MQWLWRCKVKEKLTEHNSDSYFQILWGVRNDIKALKKNRQWKLNEDSKDNIVEDS